MARFYVACLASYNNGVLHGRWVEASSDVDEMQDEVNAMLRESKFPNVTVKCVRCEGEGKVTHHNSETGDTRLCECPECIGSGRVASAEEYAVHDYDDMPSTFGEYPGLQAIADYVEFLEEHDSHDSEDLEAIIKDFGNLKDASDAMENQFICISESFREYADNAADEQMSCHSSDGKIPQFLIDYFDYEAYARDIKHDYNVIDVPSGVAIFSH